MVPKVFLTVYTIQCIPCVCSYGFEKKKYIFLVDFGLNYTIWLSSYCSKKLFVSHLVFFKAFAKIRRSTLFHK